MKRPRAKTAIVKRSLAVAGHDTSISLEPEFWAIFQTIAARRGLSLAALASEIDAERDERNLSSAIRVHVLETLLADVPSGP